MAGGSLTLSSPGELLLEAAAARFWYLATLPGVASGSEAEVSWVRTGWASNVDNGFVGEPSDVGAVASLAARLGEAPASWLFPDSAPSEATADALRTAGFRPDSGGVAMAASVADVRPSVRAAGMLSTNRVGDESTLADWRVVEQHRPDPTVRALPLDVDAALVRYVAYVVDEPAGIATAVFAPPDVVLLDDVFVVPKHRRMGVASALVAARLLDAARRRCVDAVLAPSPDGALLHRRLGFATSAIPAGRWWYSVRP